MEEWTICAGALPIIGMTTPNSQNTLMIQKMKSEIIQDSDNLIWIFTPLQAKLKRLAGFASRFPFLCMNLSPDSRIKFLHHDLVQGIQFIKVTRDVAAVQIDVPSRHIHRGMP